MKHTLYIVDDHAIIRTGLCSYIEANSSWKVLGTSGGTEDLLSYLEENAQNPDKLPEIIIFDLQLKNELCFDAISEISEKFPELKIVVFTMFDTTGFILTAQFCGVKGYVSKTQSEKELLECLEKVADGETYFPIIKEKAEKMSQVEKDLELLTKQQRRVYHEILTGKSNEEIAKSMDLKLHSVEIYINRIYEKLGIFSREDILKKR